MTLRSKTQSIRCQLALRGLGIVTLAVLAGCAGAPGGKGGSARSTIGPTEIPAPLPASPEQALDIRARNAILDVAFAEGTLAARAQRDALLIQGTDASTATLIDSDIAWLEGDSKKANALLDGLTSTDPKSYDTLLAERQKRASQQNLWLKSARLAHQRLQLARDITTQAELKNALWSQLMQLDDNQLRTASRRSGVADWRDWLALVQAYREDRSSVNRWLANHKNHSALNPLPSGLSEWLNTKTPNIVAVLLPLSGKLSSVGLAVLEGTIDNLYRTYPNPKQRPQLLTIDTDEYSDAVSAYQSAVDRGAELVIGPLTKSQAQVLGNLSQRPTPVIALNRPEALAPRQADSWLSLSLAPEDEARQIARIAFGKGLRRSVIIRPDNDWGRRMEAALQQTWRQLGGTVRGSVALTATTPASEQISRVVGGFASESRIKAVERAFETPVEARARRHEDFDSLFLLTQTPDEARSLRPLLVFHYSGDIPVFSPSSIYSGQQQLQNRDLNDVIFVETPAIINSPDTDRFTRLKALGHDAVLLLDHWQQALKTQTPFAWGDTGLLSRLPNGEVTRELIPVEFAGDKVRRLRLP